MIVSLQAEIDTALAARARLRGRSVDDLAASLAAAAARWQDDGELMGALPDDARLSPAMIGALLPIAATALDADAMLALHATEAHGVSPRFVAHVLASNVPALALPAIALGCLAGAAVIVKSGRADRHAAPAFRRALTTVDPDLAATVVCAYWRGGDADVERLVLDRADVVVASGSDASVRAITALLGSKVIAHGARTSVATIGQGALADVGTLAERLAEDVALYDQRGCLSPHVVYVEGDPAALAGALAIALDLVATRLSPGPATVEERAVQRTIVDEAEWRGAEVTRTAGGTVVVHATSAPWTPAGLRTVHVQPVDTVAAVPGLLPPDRIECVGVAGATLDIEALRRRGVARVCPVGRMQRPTLAWPRGQHPALGSLFRASSEPRIQVEWDET